MNFLAILILLDKVLADLKTFVRLDMVVQADGDSGDSAQRTGTVYAMTGLFATSSTPSKLKTANLEYERSMEALTFLPGVYRRSSDPAHWGYNPNNFSRDQWSILQLAFAANGDKKRLKESMTQLLKRKGFHQNVHPGTDAPENFRKTPDFAHPSHFSVYIRGMGYWYAYPALVIIDLLLLGDLAIRQFHDPANDLDNMLSQHILYANSKYRTPASFIAKKLYDCTNWRTKLRTYHGSTRNGISPLAELIILAYESFNNN